MHVLFFGIPSRCKVQGGVSCGLMIRRTFLSRHVFQHTHSSRAVCTPWSSKSLISGSDLGKYCIGGKSCRFPLRYTCEQSRCLSPIASTISNVFALNFSSASSSTGMDLKAVLSALRQYAPESLAESWDNVGLLVEPTPPHTVRRLLLTNDLTPAVVEEAVETKTDMIVSYHPPIFAALKRLTQGSWKERLVVRCLENRIAVYSPHTVYDALAEGVNDWLISAFDALDVEPISTSQCSGALSHRVTGSTSQARIETIQTALLNEKGCALLPVSFVPQYRVGIAGGDSLSKIEVSVACAKHQLGAVLNLLEAFQVNHLTTVELAETPLTGTGMGRRGRLSPPLTVTEAVGKLKAHLKLPHLRLATNPNTTTISSVAVCAGSGSSVLRGAKADLYVTGEMSHHDVLEAVHGSGACVLLCGHSNSERGFLEYLATTLSECLSSGVDVALSKQDADPLVVV